MSYLRKKRLFITALIVLLTLGSICNSQTSLDTKASIIYVYITKAGTKYHSDGCKYLTKSKMKINKADAIARGYSACSVCKP